MIRPVLVFCLLAVTAWAQPYATNGDQKLAAYVEQALERHPALRESLASYRSALQRIPQVSALPDPMIEVRQDIRPPETRVGPQGVMLSISQQFPWFGKLDERAKVAAKEADVQREIHETQRVEIVRQVKLAYYDLGFLDRAIEINNEEQALLEHFETLARAQYSLGTGLQQAVVKLQAEITLLRNRLELFEQQRVDAEAALNTLLDQPPETPIPLVVFDPVPAGAIELEPLYELGRRQRPELKAAFLEIEKNEKRIHSARKEFWPDVTLAAGYVNVGKRMDPAGIQMPPPDNGKDIYNVTVSLNLPIRRRKYNAAVMEATEDFLASREGYRNTANGVEAAIRGVASRLRTLEGQISLFEKLLVPQADQALRSSEAAYSTGSLGVLDLLDSERTLLEVRLGLEQFKSDYMKALAEMERAIGAAFPSERARVSARQENKP